jgi:hypothetical protein
MDDHGFPQDTYQGRHIYGQLKDYITGWFPMIQLLHTCWHVIMTYFLRARAREANWHLWTIC